MFDHLLLLTAIILGMALLRLVRRGDGNRGYFIAVTGQLVLALVAMSRDDHFLGYVAAGFCLLTVVTPWVLEGLSRRAFGRGQLALAVRLAGARTVLMPGAGLTRQQQVLHGLLLLERSGVDAALAYFRALADEVEDGGELAVIHEQIVSMLFYDQRWAEGIAHYEGQFQLGYAALRPVLALGLLRAYGEAGRLDNAAGLLRALEDGPLGADPGAAELLGQARLTFLAYAGAAAYVDEAVGGEHRESLGISRASGALFRGIALARAGDRERAVNELQRVRALAEPSEDRVVKAARAALANLEDACVELAPELGRYAHAVGERLRGFLATQRLPRRRGPVFVTHLLVAALLAGYVAAQIAGGGGAALLRMGALTPELLAAGSWGRLFTAPFVQVDLIGLLLDVYSVWLGGHVLERIPGRARAALVAIWGAAAGVYAGSLAADSPAEIVAGGSVAAVAVITAALWVLVPARTPGLAAKARRSLAFTLGLLLAAQLLECVPGEHGPGLSPLAVVGAAVVGTILGGLVPLALPRVLQALLASLAFASAAVVGVATFKVAREDVEVFLLAHRDRALEQDGVAFQTPWSFTATAAGDGLDGGLPLYAGLVDSEALRAGSQLQYVVAPKGAAAEPAIFALDPSLRLEAGVRVDDELPPRVAEILSAAPGSWSSALIQRNGELIARVIERTLPDGPRVLLISAPPDAFEVTAELHARILADAAAAPAPDTSR